MGEFPCLWRHERTVLVSGEPESAVTLCPVSHQTPHTTCSGSSPPAHPAARRHPLHTHAPPHSPLHTPMHTTVLCASLCTHLSLTHPRITVYVLFSSPNIHPIQPCLESAVYIFIAGPPDVAFCPPPPDRRTSLCSRAQTEEGLGGISSLRMNPCPTSPKPPPFAVLQDCPRGGLPPPPRNACQVPQRTSPNVLCQRERGFIYLKCLKGFFLIKVLLTLTRTGLNLE